ncbi:MULTISPECIES: 30S ribosomal protein S17 [Psittacicella]|uniref:Small ribosomal subunit protein uS17 n=3 Tax=Psittacicella TaxID=2873964 RepID=A0A3A1Y6Q8_9GAMM|nr:MULTISPECIES: 30S ribosomal protein S17 [Psittacicella]RIY32178.1 30S ribosomal protein S17 [Psittacicella melopsittaci]RIY33191.1 30S ribosomal protein S17 [Psittacicella hinzii]RIY38474.1 30S ribosomal protein S17 [Psittacicella gerlachiana]
MTKQVRTLQGRVLSDKMDKTIVVAVERRVKHPIYGKYVRKTTKLHVHDEANAAKEGDLVEIKQSRPLSKTKAFDLVRVVEKSLNV